MATEILVVDDEAAIAGLVEVYLTNEGFTVHKALTASAALDILEQAPIDLAILDVMLPDLDGFSLCQKIRETYLFPIIMLTARVEDMDKITGLTLGADDYITKPFKLGELLSSIRALLRRAGISAAQPANQMQCGDLTIDLLSGRAAMCGHPLELTQAEFRLLCLLVRNAGRVVTREVILNDLWDNAGDFVDDNTLSVYVRRLRSKVEEDPGAPRHLLTVRGFGYRWEGEA